MTISIGNQARSVSLPDIHRRKTTSPLCKTPSDLKQSSLSLASHMVKTDDSDIVSGQSNLRRVKSCPDIVKSAYSAKSHIIRLGDHPTHSDSVCSLPRLDNSERSESDPGSYLCPLSERLIHTNHDQSNLQKVKSCPDIVKSSLDSSKSQTIHLSEATTLPGSICNLPSLDDSGRSESDSISSLASLFVEITELLDSQTCHFMIPEIRAETVSSFSNCSILTLRQHSLSHASIDTIANLLESLTASKERDKRNLTAVDIILISFKRVFRHAASSTALARARVLCVRSY